jgi:ubiquinone/menaquinone biosynthesis C-methylase UbiE
LQASATVGAVRAPGDPRRIIEREREIRDTEATSYDGHRALGPYRTAVEEACVLDLLDLRPGQTLLDAGCGTGSLLPVLLERASRVVGVDHSVESLELARERVPEEQHERLELAAGDLRALPLQDAMADRALCFEVLQHIPTDDFRQQALRELHRVLRPGGLLVLSVYRWRGRIRRHKEGFFDHGLYRYAFTPRELRTAMRAAGFEDVRVGGAVVLPGISERLGVSVELQRRIAPTPVGRRLAQYLVARGSRPSQ